MEKVAPLAAAGGLPTEPALRKIRIPFLQRGTVAIGGVREQLFVVDLGLCGVFIERVKPLDPGQEIEVWFALPGDELAVHARSRVAWWRPAEVAERTRTTTGIGVEFVEMSARDAARVPRHLPADLERPPPPL